MLSGEGVSTGGHKRRRVWANRARWGTYSFHCRSETAAMAYSPRRLTLVARGLGGHAAPGAVPNCAGRACLAAFLPWPSRMFQFPLATEAETQVQALRESLSKATSRELAGHKKKVHSVAWNCTGQVRGR